jgi:hypothetical protein
MVGSRKKGEKMERATTTRWTTTKRVFLALALMLATLLAAAVPALAQQQPPPAPQVEPPVTGVLKDTGLGDNPGYEDPTYGLLDEFSGIPIVLESTVSHILHPSTRTSMP